MTNHAVLHSVELGYQLWKPCTDVESHLLYSPHVQLGPYICIRAQKRTSQACKEDCRTVAKFAAMLTFGAKLHFYCSSGYACNCGMAASVCASVGHTVVWTTLWSVNTVRVETCMWQCHVEQVPRSLHVVKGSRGLRVVKGSRGFSFRYFFRIAGTSAENSCCRATRYSTCFC